MNAECCGGSLSWENEKHASWCPGYVTDLEMRLEKAEDALARVRALICEPWQMCAGPECECAPIRAALDGE